MSKVNNKAKGDLGENIAVRELKKEGFDIIERNYRKSCGEIDIIASDNDTIVFIEVKLRTTVNNGFPSEAVNLKKQMKIIKTAKKYIFDNKLYNRNFRFDVVEILKGETVFLRHIKNAFWE